MDDTEKRAFAVAQAQDVTEHQDVALLLSNAEAILMFLNGRSAYQAMAADQTQTPASK